MRCPGQDWRYWKEDAVYEVPCPKCGASVELFKDEKSGRCTGCGHRFFNPGADFGCARWCPLAEQCLGVAPDREPASATTEGALAAQLIRAIEEEFAHDQTHLAHALRAFQYAKELVRSEGGDPRLVLSAVLLTAVANHPPTQEAAGRRKIRRILQQIGLEENTIDRVCRVIDACRTPAAPATIEAKIVADSHALAARNPGAGLDRPPDMLENQLWTEAAREKARNLFVQRPAEGAGSALFRQRKEIVTANNAEKPPRRFAVPAPQKNLARAVELGFQGLAGQTEDQLTWLGAERTGALWRLPVLSDTFDVDLAAKRITTSDGREVGSRWNILALHYLAIPTRPQRQPPDTIFANLSNARSYSSVYHGRVISRLCFTAGRSAETLQTAALSLDGRPTEGGDLAFEFDPFPRISLRLIWHAPDEEFPPSATMLLPQNIESYLCSEDIVVLSESLVARLQDKPF